MIGRLWCGDREAWGGPWPSRRVELGATRGLVEAVEPSPEVLRDASRLEPRQTAGAVEGWARRARELIEHADAPNTRRAYASDARAFEAWRVEAGIVDAVSLPIPVAVVAAWIAAQSERGLAVATIARRVAWLARVHRHAGLASPTDATAIADMLRGARRLAVPPQRVAPFTVDMARVAIPQLMKGETGPRDRAILLVGLVTGMRRDELASLVWGQVIESRRGRVIREGWTKNHHETGRMIGVPRAGGEFCPVGALTAIAGGAGPLERVFGCSPATVARVVKRAATMAGEDPARFGGHSLRAGCVSEAGAAGISLAIIMSQTGHKSTDTAASYTRDLSADQNPAALAIVQLLTSPRLM